MSTDQLQSYLEFAKKLAYEAGDIMKKYYGKQPASRLKQDNTIVTVADEEINEMVIRSVKAAYPDHSVDGEEASHDVASSYVWVCDPIDGTNVFEMEIPVSVFSLALVLNGVPEIGVIYAPFGQHMYTAARGGGAFMNDEPIHVSKAGFDAKARMSVDWHAFAEYDVMKSMHRLAYDEKISVLCPGSTTHSGALVARGAFVASVFPGTDGKNVDIAAAKVIVEEAGGRVTDVFGNEQRYDRAIKGAVLSNGIVHDEIIDYLKQDMEASDEI